MKLTTVLLKPDCLYYKSKEYSFFEVDELKKGFLPKVKIVILNEVLYVKKFECKNKILNIEKSIQEKIDEYFPQNGGILYDYIINKKNSLMLIYSIKNGNNIEKICEDAKEIEIIPIQYIIGDVVKRLSKNAKITCLIIVEIENVYYSILISEGYILNNSIEENIEEIIKKQLLFNKDCTIYIDKAINVNLDELIPKKYQIIREDIVSKVYEKIY